MRMYLGDDQVLFVQVDDQVSFLQHSDWPGRNSAMRPGMKKINWSN